VTRSSNLGRRISAPPQRTCNCRRFIPARTMRLIRTEQTGRSVEYVGGVSAGRLLAPDGLCSRPSPDRAARHAHRFHLTQPEQDNRSAFSGQSIHSCFASGRTEASSRPRIYIHAVRHKLSRWLTSGQPVAAGSVFIRDGIAAVGDSLNAAIVVDIPLNSNGRLGLRRWRRRHEGARCSHRALDDSRRRVDGIASAYDSVA